MLNWWLTFIQNRVFYLRNHTGGLVKHIYTRTGDREWLQVTPEYYSAREVEIMAEKALDSYQLRMGRSPMLQEFWDSADPVMKQGVLFSYFWHQLQEKPKVFNVEINLNWFRQHYFAEYLQAMSLVSEWRNIRRGRQYLDAVCRTTAKHHTGWRYENIHLTYDQMQGREVFGIHWDNYAAIPLSFEHLGHLLFDDQLG